MDDSAVETPANTLVYGVYWQAVLGDPMDNPELAELINSLTLMSPESIREIVEDYFDTLSAISPKALKALEKIAELMEDLDIFDFVELMHIFESKLDIVVFNEHDQDTHEHRHLDDEDRALLASVGDLEEAVRQFVISFGNMMSQTKLKLESLQNSLLETDKKLTSHIGDTEAHFIEDEKHELFDSVEKLKEAAANFDNAAYMSGCKISIDYSVKGMLTETAMKGEVLFARRITDYTDTKNIITKTYFYFESGTLGVESVVRIGEGNQIMQEIYPIEDIEDEDEDGEADE